jgi:hypothetical protein
MAPARFRDTICSTGERTRPPAIWPSTRIALSDLESTPPSLTRRDFLQTSAVGLAAGALPRAHLVAPATHASTFAVRFDRGAIVSLKRVDDAVDTDYVQDGRRLGDAVIAYRVGAGAWQTFETATATNRRLASTNDQTTHGATYLTDDGTLSVTVGFVVNASALQWTIELENLGTLPVEIGDLAFPLLMNGDFQQHPTTAVLKHAFVSGHGSHIFWMRRTSMGPYLTMTPDERTSLEYWETTGGYRVFVHSAAAGAVAREHGTNWRQPNTSLTLASRGQRGSRQRYGFKFQWAADYDDVRAIVAREGLVDVQIVPGMTLPRDLTARIALRSAVPIHGVVAEHPRETTIAHVGRHGDAELYEARFAKLGENRLTVSFGANRHMYLEFFSTEPVETLISKRAAFVASHQHRDPSKWYNGLLAEWAMDTHVLLGPDNYDRIKGWRIYEVTCDDPGLSKPAYLASKSAERPVQSEVAALDYYIEHFVWGGLQRTTSEEYAYAIYGIPDWKQNRDSRDPGRNGRRHIWRIYDYPHIALMYFGMYRVAKHHPEIHTALGATEYLRRAYGTAVAMFTIPFEVERWSAYQTGLYNELVIPDVIAALDEEGLRDQAERLRAHWERKVRSFIGERPDLFRSEYAFDSTGFESTHALAKYALEHATEFARERPANERAPAISPATLRQFLEQEIQANIFCRGWLEPAYYLYGSDYRGSGGSSYTLTYMSTMGGWGVLDYALYYAADFAPYLRLGYASALSVWALLNSGTAESNYGYWYPGPENDGGAGGGFEPAPYGATWLEQPHHRGSWYYSCEIDLGFCGALRCARTVLADDPVFGRICYGGEWRNAGTTIEVIPNDGVRRRFHALLGGRRLHVVLANDRFAKGRPVSVDDTLTRFACEIESDDRGAHTTRVTFRAPVAAEYLVQAAGAAQRIGAPADQEVSIDVPISGGSAQVSVDVRYS